VAGQSSKSKRWAFGCALHVLLAKGMHYMVILVLMLHVAAIRYCVEGDPSAVSPTPTTIRVRLALDAPSPHHIPHSTAAQCTCSFGARSLSPHPFRHFTYSVSNCVCVCVYIHRLLCRSCVPSANQPSCPVPFHHQSQRAKPATRPPPLLLMWIPLEPHLSATWVGQRTLSTSIARPSQKPTAHRHPPCSGQ